MLHKLIIINGTARTGKDTFVAYCGRQWRLTHRAICEMYSTVKPIKEMFRVGYDIQEKDMKTPQNRLLLSGIKDLLTKHGDLPFKAMLRIATYLEDCGVGWNKNLFFAMVREPKEIAKLVQEYPDKAITVLVSRKVDTIPNNPSDQNVWEYSYDYVVNNNGSLEDLKMEAKKFCEFIR